MQFLLVAFDGTDHETLERRMKTRIGHLENEPYIIQGVWKKIDIRPFRLAQIEK